MAFIAPDGTVLEVNQTACELWGRSAEELVGMPGRELPHRDDLAGVLASMEQLREGAIDAVRAERRYVRPDGSTVWADLTLQAVHGPGGEVLYLQALLVDITERRRAQEDQARLAAIVQSSQDAIIGSRLDSVITSWNPGAERLYGYAADEVIGRRGDFLLPPDRRDESEGLMARILAGERLEQYRTKRLRKDGTLVSVSVGASPIYDAAGAIVGVASVARDLTDREQAESRFQGLLEAAPVAIIGGDLDWRIVLANAQADALFGYPPGELVGQPVRDLFPDYVEAVQSGGRSRLATNLAPGEIVTIELTGRRRDGAEFTAEMSVTTMETEEGWLALAGIRDATERELAAIVRSSSDAIIGKTVEGVITSWNEGAEEMYGYTPGEMVGQSVYKLVPSDRSGELRDLLASVAAGERVEHLETQRLRKDGGVIDVSLSVSPIRSAAGEIVGASAVARDVTDRNRITAERDALQMRLRQSERLESLGQLAGGVAHDFNNLLNVVSSYASFVAEEVAENEAVRRDVEQISAAAERGARLTRQLLLFAKRATVEPELLDLNEVLAETAQLLSRTIGEHVELVVRPADALPAICADHGQVEQVLLNLAVNARDAMPTGGTLILETRESKLDEEYSRLHPGVRPGRYVELAVSDTGIGMSPDVVARVFEPFFTTKLAGEGTGLGLSTVYGILTEAGGTLGVYSELGKGTTVRAYFPAQEVAAPTQRPTPARPIDETAGTILVIEDDPAMMKVTTRMLRKHGYSVLEATNGSEALGLVADHDLHLVLTDSVMPQMSGQDLAARIGEILPRLPVLFMSGYSEGVLQPDKPAGENVPLIQKPFSEQALLEWVHSAIAGEGPPPRT
jgi:PAS domain S-box-containing protein